MSRDRDYLSRETRINFVLTVREESLKEAVQVGSPIHDPYNFATSGPPVTALAASHSAVMAFVEASA